MGGGEEGGRQGGAKAGRKDTPRAFASPRGCRGGRCAQGRRDNGVRGWVGWQSGPVLQHKVSPGAEEESKGG